MGTLVMELDLIEDRVFHFRVVDSVKYNNLELDMSFSAHIDNKKKDILILGKGPAQGLEYTLTAEKMYSINFTVTKVTTSYLFVNGTEIYKFKAKYSEIVATPLYLGNISKDWSVNNMKNRSLMDMYTILMVIMMLLMLMTY